MEAELNGLEIRFQERRLRKEETLGFEHEQSFVGLEMENANREAEEGEILEDPLFSFFFSPSVDFEQSTYIQQHSHGVYAR